MKTVKKLVFSGILLTIMLILTLIIPGTVQAQYYSGSQYYGCISQAYLKCSGTSLYWYDSCGNQQYISQYCENGCSGNACLDNYNYNYNYNNNYNNYGNCTYHAYKLCQGNNIYWYDSCGTRQDLYYACGVGQTCQYGQCVTFVQNYTAPVSNYVAHYKTACYGNSLYWYDSLGVGSGLYKSCIDTNSCTADNCASNKCSNIVKCDGSTCAVGTADYNSHCLPPVTPAPTADQTHCGNTLCEPNLEETNISCPADCKLNAVNNLSISFFSKQDANSTQWQKTTQVDSNSKIYFMISAINNSTTQIDNINISASIPGEIVSLGNLQINGIPVSGDIVSGINLGSIAPTNTKSITFEGITQAIQTTGTKQATAMSNVSGITQSDSVSINLDATQAAASVSSTTTTSGFMEFIKKWYLWIVGAVVLIFLFIIVFRRLSSES